MSDVATYNVWADFNGETHHFRCRENQTVLNAAEAAGIVFPVPVVQGSAPPVLL